MITIITAQPTQPANLVIPSSLADLVLIAGAGALREWPENNRTLATGVRREQYPGTGVPCSL